MATRITLNDVLPPIWASLSIEKDEIQRIITRKAFNKIMVETETIVSPSVISRMWETLARSEFGAFSPFTRDKIILDVPRIKQRLISNGHRLDGFTHITYNTCNTYDATNKGASNTQTVEARLR